MLNKIDGSLNKTLTLDGLGGMGLVPMELKIPLSFLTNLLLVGFLISASVFPGIRVTGRLSTDPLNQLDSAEVTLATGGAVTLATGGAASDSSRWVTILPWR